MAKTMIMVRLMAERVIANLESTITIGTLFSLSGTTSGPVSAWSLVVKWSLTTSLPSDSVVVGSFILITEVVNGEISGMIDTAL